MGRKAQDLYYYETPKERMSGKEALLWCVFSLGIIWIGTSFMLAALESETLKDNVYFVIKVVHFFAGILTPTSAAILVFWVVFGELTNYRKFKKPDIF